MRHVLVGVRAFGESLFWGAVGGAAYGLALGVVLTLFGGGLDEVDAVFTFWVVAAGVFGFISGVVTGAVGMVIAATASVLDAADSAGGRLVVRMVSAVVSGACVAATCWWMWDRNELLGSPSTTGEWMQLVVLPGVAAAAVGAWRAVPILRWRLPRAESTLASSEVAGPGGGAASGVGGAADESVG